MGKFDHLNKLQVQAELRRIENIPREFWGEEVQALRDRLDEILDGERHAEVARDERKHLENIAAARRSRIASFLSVSAAVVSAAAAVISAYFAAPRSAAPVAQRDKLIPAVPSPIPQPTPVAVTPSPIAATPIAPTSISATP